MQKEKTDKPTFAIIGSSGYIAPRHREAIDFIKGEVVAECDIFTDMKWFVNQCEIHKPDYLVVCSPNYLHTEHCAFGLALGMDVICEKPVALNSKDIFELKQLEGVTKKNVYTIMQLRYLFSRKAKAYNKMKVKYYLPRDDKYFLSWKGDDQQSGGIVFNIGIHIFDLCLLFGGHLVAFPIIYYKDDKEIWGKLFLSHGEVEFNLSIKDGEPLRLFQINGKHIDFTNYSKDLHKISYLEIMDGKGFTLGDALPSITLCEQLIGE